MIFVFTISGAGSSDILARVIMPNWPSPPRTLWKRSLLCFSEQVTTSPFPAHIWVQLSVRIYTMLMINIFIREWWLSFFIKIWSSEDQHSEVTWSTSTFSTIWYLNQTNKAKVSVIIISHFSFCPLTLVYSFMTWLIYYQMIFKNIFFFEPVTTSSWLTLLIWGPCWNAWPLTPALDRVPPTVRCR